MLRQHPETRQHPVIEFLKPNWWKILIALAVIGIGVALCITGIGSLLGVPLIISTVAESLTILTALGTLGASALIVCGGLAVIAGAGYVIGKIADGIRAWRAKLETAPQQSGSTTLKLSMDHGLDGRGQTLENKRGHEAVAGRVDDAEPPQLQQEQVNKAGTKEKRTFRWRR